MRLVVRANVVFRSSSGVGCSQEDCSNGTDGAGEIVERLYTVREALGVGEPLPRKWDTPARTHGVNGDGAESGAQSRQTELVYKLCQMKLDGQLSLRFQQDKMASKKDLEEFNRRVEANPEYYAEFLKFLHHDDHDPEQMELDLEEDDVQFLEEIIDLTKEDDIDSMNLSFEVERFLPMDLPEEIDISGDVEEETIPDAVKEGAFE
ncbi:hypothetical protein DAPPUDRAFT_267463 [Daphnia pulex]|uniref:Uncharacterized protein n=1 Tax=Daphnia pulex TaxID=6669 RepID=E9HWJ4_DAPPU|nr:hypothetical protein DAPPUDRAFT_267463 [Daphnia pulex]|eukprot:EFX63883.1 hypothetical protein DAPPUDRAFT_267463 [Daphnia pulex]